MEGVLSMEYVISLVWIFLEVLSYMFFADAFLEKRRGKKETIISFFLIWIISFVCTRFISSSLLRMSLTLLLSVGLSLYLFKGFWARHILCFLLSYIFGSLIDTFIAYGASSLLGISFDELIWKQLLYSVIGTVAKLLCIFIAYVIRRIRKPYGPQTIRVKWLLLTSPYMPTRR